MKHNEKQSRTNHSATTGAVNGAEGGTASPLAKVDLQTMRCTCPTLYWIIRNAAFELSCWEIEPDSTGAEEIKALVDLFGFGKGAK